MVNPCLESAAPPPVNPLDKRNLKAYPGRNGPCCAGYALKRAGPRRKTGFFPALWHNESFMEDGMGRVVAAVSILLVFAAIGFAAWLGFSDMSPPVSTVQVEVPDTDLPR